MYCGMVPVAAKYMYQIISAWCRSGCKNSNWCIDLDPRENRSIACFNLSLIILSFVALLLLYNVILFGMLCYPLFACLAHRRSIISNILGFMYAGAMWVFMDVRWILNLRMAHSVRCAQVPFGCSPKFLNRATLTTRLRHPSLCTCISEKSWKFGGFSSCSPFCSLIWPDLVNFNTRFCTILGETMCKKYMNQ